MDKYSIECRLFNSLLIGDKAHVQACWRSIPNGYPRQIGNSKLDYCARNLLLRSTMTVLSPHTSVANTLTGLMASCFSYSARVFSSARYAGSNNPKSKLAVQFSFQSYCHSGTRLNQLVWIELKGQRVALHTTMLDTSLPA